MLFVSGMCRKTDIWSMGRRGGHCHNCPSTVTASVVSNRVFRRHFAQKQHSLKESIAIRLEKICFHQRVHLKLYNAKNWVFLQVFGF
ncbi:hypothetical protein CEXT_350401 [Caerostris extrusa]|uniref:Uncharacterized protein n=1 Tax=Caerostris extrusa TaxID=172846 RepID=A0AAV4Y3T9_CAEEX|nr:hypothetical protein CEXT_350401 [Caerostris extrusa]